MPTSQFDLQFENLSGIGYSPPSRRPTIASSPLSTLRGTNQTCWVASSSRSSPIPFPRTRRPSTVLVGAAYDRTVDDKAATAGIGWSHTFGYRNVFNAAVFATGVERQSDESGFSFSTAAGPLVPVASTINANSEQQTYLGAVNHTYGIGDLTLRYGVEAGTLDYRTSTVRRSTLGRSADATRPRNQDRQ